MRKKPKTMRAIEPNAGTRAALEKKLAAFSQALMRTVARQILAELVESGDLTPTAPDMAQDAMPKLTDKENEALKNAQMALHKGLTPQAARARIDKAAASKIARVLTSAGENARKVSQWFVRTAARDVTSSQRRALADAGVSPNFLKEKWSVPLIRGQRISPQAAEQIPSIVEEMTELITKMASDDLARLQETIVEGLLNGQSIGALESTLRASSGFSAARAKRVALDQSIKVNQAVQRANCEAAGITEAIWVHVPGQYSSRASHIAMNGKRFKLDKGLYDSAVGHCVLPGSEPFCRCIHRNIIPPELLK